MISFGDDVSTARFEQPCAPPLSSQLFTLHCEIASLVGTNLFISGWRASADSFMTCENIRTTCCSFVRGPCSCDTPHLAGARVRVVRRKCLEIPACEQNERPYPPPFLPLLLLFAAFLSVRLTSGSSQQRSITRFLQRPAFVAGVSSNVAGEKTPKGALGNVDRHAN